MDDINNNDNDHNTLTDVSDAIASSKEMPSGLVTVNSGYSAPSLGLQTQAPQHVTNVTSPDVISAKVGASLHIAHGLLLSSSKSSSSLISVGSKKFLRIMICYMRKDWMLMNPLFMKTLAIIHLQMHNPHLMILSTLHAPRL